MTRRPRRDPEPGDFHDPLNDYADTAYDDAFEQAICEDPIADLATSPPICVHPHTPVSDVVELMADKNLACVLVCDDGRPVGIFSERDVLSRIAPNPDRTLAMPISEVMTESPAVVYETDHPARVLGMMSEGGFRHLPLVDVHGNCIGLIGSRNLMKYLESQLAADT